MKNLLKESIIFAGLMALVLSLVAMAIYLGVILGGGNLELLSKPLADGIVDSTTELDLTFILSLTLAGLEDVLFVLPALFLYKRGYKNTGMLLLAISAGMFGALHLYQGIGGMNKIVYPFLAFIYAKDKGISRTILGHSICDVVVVSLALLLLNFVG
jgi:hypothetical protein